MSSDIDNNSSSNSYLFYLQLRAGVFTSSGLGSFVRGVCFLKSRVVEMLLVGGDAMEDIDDNEGWLQTSFFLPICVHFLANFEGSCCADSSGGIVRDGN